MSCQEGKESDDNLVQHVSFSLPNSVLVGTGKVSCAFSVEFAELGPAAALASATGRFEHRK